jgi:glycosyltransferase involved in cell wall biosynthesis
MTDEMPSTVTVVVTTFNQIAFIDQAIRSVLMQETSFPFDLLVADDASTDGTREVVRRLDVENPGRIRCFFPDANMGNGGGTIFRHALALCRAPYVALLDGDDYWTSSQKLQKQIDLLERRRDCIGAFHRVDILDQESGRVIGTMPVSVDKELYTLDDFVSGTAVSSSSTVFRSDLLPQLPDWIFNSPYGDWGLQATYAARAPLAFLPERMGVYRKHRHGVWSGLDAVQRFEILVEQTATMPERFPAVDLRRVRRSLALRSFELSVKYRSVGRYRDAIRAAVRGLRAGGSATLPLVFVWRSLMARIAASRASASEGNRR